MVMYSKGYKRALAFDQFHLIMLTTKTWPAEHVRRCTHSTETSRSRARVRSVIMFIITKLHLLPIITELDACSVAAAELNVYAVLQSPNAVYTGVALHTQLYVQVVLQPAELRRPQMSSHRHLSLILNVHSTFASIPAIPHPSNSLDWAI